MVKAGVAAALKRALRTAASAVTACTRPPMRCASTHTCTCSRPTNDPSWLLCVCVLATGAAMYPASLLEAVYKDLLAHSYGNPHSAGLPPVPANRYSSNSSSSTVAVPPAAASEAVIEAAAAAVLEHMHADPAEYQVVFTRWVCSRMCVVYLLTHL